MILIYRSIMFLIYLAVLPFGWFRARRGSMIWRQRLLLDTVSGPFDLWIHASSVGEVKIVSYLVDYLLRTAPTLNILVTVITETGHKAASAEFAGRVTVRFFPADASALVRRALGQIQPKMIVIAETEIWPNFILEAHRIGIPLILINGRMSEKANRRYGWMKKSMRRVLACHRHFFFKTPEDAARYAEYGVGPDRVTVAGDMKFDAPLIDKSPDKLSAIRRQAGVASDEFLLVAGSTRPGEEAQLCALYTRVKAQCPRLRLLLAPRHVDRVDDIKALLAQLGLGCRLFGESTSESSGCEVILVDRMGILNDLYAAADLAFVGGTLADIGGHNILEPVWAGTPVVYGPSLANVSESARYIERHKFGMRVESAEELTQVVADICAKRLSFRIKSAEDFRHSPTAMIGDYIMKQLRHD
jgi:3-deoxy-D-manno-octulosonic-acid transferase